MFTDKYLDLGFALSNYLTSFRAMPTVFIDGYTATLNGFSYDVSAINHDVVQRIYQDHVDSLEYGRATSSPDEDIVKRLCLSFYYMFYINKLYDKELTRCNVTFSSGALWSLAVFIMTEENEYGVPEIINKYRIVDLVNFLKISEDVIKQANEIIRGGK